MAVRTNRARLAHDVHLLQNSRFRSLVKQDYRLRQVYRVILLHNSHNEIKSWVSTGSEVKSTRWYFMVCHRIQFSTVSKSQQYGECLETRAYLHWG